MTTPLGHQWTYSYDPAGHLTTTVDGNGNATPASGDGTTASSYDRAGPPDHLRQSDQCTFRS
jgi:YD repeat-containing protein